jgi:hypothetical protein
VNTICSVSQKQIPDKHPVRIQIYIDGILVQFELDTSSPITIINANVWKTMGKPKLHRVKLVHNSFPGHPIRI